jgi:hypothetical protein
MTNGEARDSARQTAADTKRQYDAEASAVNNN